MFPIIVVAFGHAEFAISARNTLHDIPVLDVYMYKCVLVGWQQNRLRVLAKKNTPIKSETTYQIKTFSII